MSRMRISAKNLGLLALPDACERCFWMRAKLGWKSPWAIMPGIFSSIDAFSKRAILAYFEANGRFPPWIAGRWADARPLPTPHHSTFRRVDSKTGIILTGVPDLMIGLPNDRLAILDLKTARFSDHQDFLLPMYQTQLNGYALIAESLGMGTVEALGLVYCEPPAGDEGGFVGGAIGGVVLGVVGYIKGLNAFDRVVKCPNCGTDMAVKKSHTRPFHHCPNCGGLVRLNGSEGGGTLRANQNSNECPNCGYRTSFNVARNPDKYCGNCGKRLGG